MQKFLYTLSVQSNPTLCIYHFKQPQLKQRAVHSEQDKPLSDSAVIDRQATKIQRLFG